MTQELYLKPAAAYVRGLCQSVLNLDLPAPLKDKPLDVLSVEELAQLCEIGRNAGLRLHRYKRSNALPRVRKVLGILKSLQPTNLLDIGSGRGAFLWPLLDTLPLFHVTAIDISEQRASQLRTVAMGGLDQLSAHKMDATALSFESAYFDVVTALEVLEHIPKVATAITEMVRVARRFVIASVPSKEDNNPEHIHCFTQPEIRQLFVDARVRQVNVDYVHNHMIVVAAINHARA